MKQKYIFLINIFNVNTRQKIKILLCSLKLLFKIKNKIQIINIQVPGWLTIAIHEIILLCAGIIIEEVFRNWANSIIIFNSAFVQIPVDFSAEQIEDGHFFTSCAEKAELCWYKEQTVAKKNEMKSWWGGGGALS